MPFGQERLHQQDLDFVARAVHVARLQRNRQKLLEAETYEAAAGVLREVAP